MNTLRPKFGGDSKIRTYSPERTDLQSAATLQLCRVSKNYHIETHYQSPGFEPTSLVVYHDFYGRASNVFLYGRGTENRTLIIWLKARYFRR